MALSFFLGTLFAGGLSILLLSGPEEPPADLGVIEWDLLVAVLPSEDREQLTSGVEAVEGVAETQYIEDMRMAYPEGVPSTGTTDPQFAALLVRLEDEQLAEAVSAELNTLGYLGVVLSPEIVARRAEQFFFEAAVGATVLNEDPLILQPTLGPEPRFDTSSFGQEIPLSPAQPGDPIVDRIQQEAERRQVPAHAFLPDDTRPILHLGRVDQMDAHLVLYPALEDRFLITSIHSNGSGSGGGDFAFSRFGVAGSGSSGLAGHIKVVVPPDTALVAIVLDSGERMWQRPVADWALFPVRGSAGYITITVEAYDPAGDLLGTWVDTPRP